MKRIYAPIDNKNILEDGLDEIIDDLYEAPDHYKGGHRHKIGFLQLKDDSGDVDCEACVDVSWHFGDNSVEVKLLAYNEHVNCLEETKQEVFKHYTRFFKEWENEDLQVECHEMISSTPLLRVSLYFVSED